MSMGDRKLTVCIAGGGNGAHVCACLASLRSNVEVRVISLFADEAERWRKALETSDLHITGSSGDKPIELHSKPHLITNNPEQAVKGADLIIFVVPAFAHGQYFKAIRPYLQPGTVIASIPGGAGWDFEAMHHLGDIGKTCTFMNYLTLPWNCRILEYGTKVWVMSIKNELDGGIREGNQKSVVPAVESLQYILGEKPKLLSDSHLIFATLVYVNACIHPTVMYGEWKNWNGKPVAENPLFYQGLSEETAEMMSTLNAEVLSVGKEITKYKPNIKTACLRPLKDILIGFYTDQIADKSDLFHVLRTNKGYQGLRHPVVGEAGNFKPNFDFRYLTEDIPFGLCVIKGIAEIVGIATPTLDTIVYWSQAHLNKEFIVDGKLQGKDIGITRSPQRYGFKSLDEIL